MDLAAQIVIETALAIFIVASIYICFFFRAGRNLLWELKHDD